MEHTTRDWISLVKGMLHKLGLEIELTLSGISDDFKTTGLSFDDDFRSHFIESVLKRSLKTYDDFQMKLHLEQLASAHETNAVSTDASFTAWKHSTRYGHEMNTSQSSIAAGRQSHYSDQIDVGSEIISSKRSRMDKVMTVDSESEIILMENSACQSAMNDDIAKKTVNHSIIEIDDNDSIIEIHDENCEESSDSAIGDEIVSDGNDQQPFNLGKCGKSYPSLTSCYGDVSRKNASKKRPQQPRPPVKQLLRRNMHQTKRTGMKPPRGNMKHLKENLFLLIKNTINDAMQQELQDFERNS